MLNIKGPSIVSFTETQANRVAFRMAHLKEDASLPEPNLGEADQPEEIEVYDWELDADEPDVDGPTPSIEIINELGEHIEGAQRCAKELGSRAVIGSLSIGIGTGAWLLKQTILRRPENE